jgi:hypothetical protein
MISNSNTELMLGTAQNYFHKLTHQSLEQPIKLVYYFYPHITNEKTNIKKLGTFAFLLD